jgi:hypothetical protein
MEIIELKSAWNLLQQEIITNDNVDEGKIINLLHSKSKSEISKIKRGLQLKFVIATLSSIVAIGLAIIAIVSPAQNPLDFVFSPQESASFFLVMAITISIVVFFSVKAYMLIKTIQQSSLNLKDNLKTFIDAMKKAVALNIFSDTIMTPIIFTWVYYAYAFKNHSLGFDLRTALLFVLPIIIGLLSFFLQKLMQQLKFGKYLDRLSAYLDDLENNSLKL